MYRMRECAIITGCCLVWMLGTARAFSRPPRASWTTTVVSSTAHRSMAWQRIRGGQQADSEQEAPTPTTTTTPTISSSSHEEFLPSEDYAPVGAQVDAPVLTAHVSSGGVHRSLLLSPVWQVGARLGPFYASMLDQYPIRTKSVTAGVVFGLSDYLAQRLESSSHNKGSKRPGLNWTRMVVSAAVGLLYFGPAAHHWYEMIFRILPGTSLWSTLQKAALGQLIFGPSFTCIFFATSLMQAGSFSLTEWGRKIRRDLPGAWLAGVGFWPLVDLVSYKAIAKEWIPLFVNMCSLVWTIYLSLIANRNATRNTQ